MKMAPSATPTGENGNTPIQAARSSIHRVNTILRPKTSSIPVSVLTNMVMLTWLRELIGRTKSIRQDGNRNTMPVSVVVAMKDGMPSQAATPSKTVSSVIQAMSVMD